MSRQMWERLTAGMHMLERCLEAAFRFLLDREPKESILGQFDVKVISSYFPEFSGSWRVTSRGPKGIVHALVSRPFAELCSATWRMLDPGSSPSATN